MSSEHEKIKGGGPLLYMAKNAVAANLIMLALMVGGVILAPKVKKEVFPEVAVDMVTVSVPYPGASPEEVEQGVVLVIEEAVRGLDGVKKVTSSSLEGAGVVSVELLTDADTEEVTADVENAVNRISSFPADAERPIISQPTSRRQVISLVISGDFDEGTLKALGERMREELLTKKEITVVELTAVRNPEVSVEVSQSQLRAFNLTIENVARSVGQGSVDLPGGSVKTPSGEVLLRTKERRMTGEEFENLSIISKSDGSDVSLREMANVVDGFQETDQEASFDGVRAIKIDVYRVGDQTPIEVSDAVKDYIVEQQNKLPEGVTLAVWMDRSELYRDRVDLLMRNGMYGLILVLIVLGLFLEVRLAFWVTMGIPISFLGTMLFLPMFDVSINMISLFAFILTLGIVVDDAIVVGEAVYKYREDGMSPLAAAIAGVREVAVPVVFSVLTTIVAFMPLLFVPGMMGKFFWVIPTVVIVVLTISLVESLLVLPAHLGHLKTKPRGLFAVIGHYQNKFTVIVEWWIQKIYKPSVEAATSLRYLTFAIGVATLVVAIGYVGSGALPFTFMPKIEGDNIITNLRMPFGTPAAETREIQERLVKAAQETLDELGPDTSRGIYAELGQSGGGSFGPGGAVSGGSHLSQVTLYLVSADKRKFTTEEFTKRWRENMGEVMGAEALTFKFNIGPGSGMPIDVKLSHSDPEVLEAAAQELAEVLATYEGVTDIDSGVSLGKEQLDLTLKPEARSLGITQDSLARQLRSAFFGSEADRIQRGRDELRIFVRRPRGERDSESNIEDMIIKTPSGGEMPLHQAANIKRGRSYTSIERKDGRRVLSVTADVDTKVTTSNEVIADLEKRGLPELLGRHDGLTYEFTGMQEDQRESLGALKDYYILALMVMFVLMAVVFRSYFQPVIIMLAIPFGVVGALMGHIIMGYGLSLISMMGIVALSGVVVNDSLVLIDATNSFRASGMSASEAIIAGATRRFRPILLTTLTTFFGLVPMILETSVQARFLIPMALSLGFGVLFTTFVILMLVPAVYMIGEDFGGLFRKVTEYIWGDEPTKPLTDAEQQ